VKSLAKILVSPLVLIFSLTALQAQPGAKGLPGEVNGAQITGRVVGHGKPLPGALITLWRHPLAEPIGNNIALTGRTDADGFYKLEGVPAGNYFISATADGFVTGRENEIVAGLRSVTIVSSGRLEPINFLMVPAGLIEGSVTDAEGKPVTRTPITLFPESLTPADAPVPPYARDIYTSEQGRFRINNVPPGRYRIAAGYGTAAAATYRGRVGYRRTFYPEAADEAHAGVIEIAIGAEVKDANINVGSPLKTFSVSARIVDGKTGQPVEDADYRLDTFSDGKRNGGVPAPGRSNNRGEITINNLPPGEYVIRVPDFRNGSAKIEPAPQPSIFGTSAHFKVVDRNVEGIEIRISRTASVSGFVVVEGPAGSDVLNKVPQMHVMAFVLPKPGELGSSGLAAIKPDGSFICSGLTPGTLRFSFTGPAGPDQLPLRLVRIERDGVRIDNDLGLESGDQISDLRLVLGYANSSVRGVVKLNAGPFPPHATATVALLQYGKVIESGPVDSHGNFLLQHLPAGEYALAVTGRDTDNKYWRVEQKITLYDNKISEAMVELNATDRSTRILRVVHGRFAR
jgi:protocatechuate 3,4-dioxygenase beta subunit